MFSGLLQRDGRGEGPRGVNVPLPGPHPCPTLSRKGPLQASDPKEQRHTTVSLPRTRQSPTHRVSPLLTLTSCQLDHIIRQGSLRKRQAPSRRVHRVAWPSTVACSFHSSGDPTEQQSPTRRPFAFLLPLLHTSLISFITYTSKYDAIIFSSFPRLQYPIINQDGTSLLHPKAAGGVPPFLATYSLT